MGSTMLSALSSLFPIVLPALGVIPAPAWLVIVSTLTPADPLCWCWWKPGPSATVVPGVVMALPSCSMLSSLADL